MTNEELNNELYDKMFEEQERFRGWLLEQPPQDILDCAYRYMIQEDILLAMEDNSLTDEQAKMLLDSPRPLYDVYNAFENISSIEHMESIWDCIESHADALIDLQKEKDSVPLYREPAAYAREHDELDAYRASFQANIACKVAIETAISEKYRDNRLDTSCVKPIMERFGVERVEYVLAATVQVKDWDERFSRSNKAWAATVPVVDDGNEFTGDRRTRFVVDRPHSGLTDLFVTAFRKELKQREQAQEPSKRESVLAMLNKPAPSNAAPAPRKSHSPEL